MKKQAFEPDICETYWYIDDEGYIKQRKWYEDRVDEWAFKIGNCFKTQAEAERYKEKVV